jgi:hypothetical protein
MVLDGAPKCRSIEHREDFERIGHLHGRCILIAIAGDDAAAEPLCGNREFTPEFARAKEHECRKVHGDSG